MNEEQRKEFKELIREVIREELDRRDKYITLEDGREIQVKK